MSLLDQRADAHIEAAIQRGELDDLPGHGQPLPEERLDHVPASLRAGYRLLHNAGYVPPEIAARRELRQVEDLLACLPARSPRAAALVRRARWIETGLLESPRGRALLDDTRYGPRISARLAGDMSHRESGS